MPSNLIEGNPLLSKLLRAKMEERGPIPFAEFMEIALYDPDHGYYAGSSSAIPTGKSGDYFTSVSVGPLFGECLAHQLAEMWKLAGSPPYFPLVEQGAMDAQLGIDVLHGLRDFAPDCFLAATLHILEPLAARRTAQQSNVALATFSEKVMWHCKAEDIGQSSDSMRTRQEAFAHGAFFCNELVDAFPVCLIVRKKGEWLERHVTWAHSHFTFIDLPPASARLTEAIHKLPLPHVENYITEINLAARPWIRSLATLFQQGFFLTIDYGLSRPIYYHPARVDGTLRCFRAHRRYTDPLACPGLQDITADVDFTTLVEEGEAAGLHLLGYVDQQHFLMGNAPPLFTRDVPELIAASASYRAKVRAWQTLTHPELMGRQFQVLIQSKGFGGKDLKLAGLRYARPFWH